jgi:nitrite reductase (NADH) large subunit
MGSHPFVPPIAGANRENVTVLRTREDADFILERSRDGARCAVIGGGLLGLETAGALSRQGAEVTVLEGFGWLLPRQLNQKAGEILEKHLSETGVRFRTGVRVKEFVGDELVRGVQLEEGESIDADLVVVSAGVRPNSYLARIAGLKVATGVVVDDHLQSSHPDVLAAGDVAEHRGVLYGTWGPSQFQGTIAGMNAAGVPTEFGGIPRSNMLKVFDYDMFSIGQVQTEDASYDIVEQSVGDDYFYFVFRDTHLQGAILMGDTSLSSGVKTFVEKELDCSSLLRTRPDARQVLEYIEQNG